MRCSDEKSYPLYGSRAELESGDTISAAASVLVQAGLLATCLSSDLGWVSCTVHTVLYTLYSTVHCTQLAAVSSPVSRLSPTITLSWTLATARPLLHPAAILLVTTSGCQLQIVRTLHQARAQNMICGVSGVRVTVLG